MVHSSYHLRKGSFYEALESLDKKKIFKKLTRKFDEKKYLRRIHNPYTIATKIQDSNVHRWSFGQKRPICEPTHFAYSEPAKRSHTLLIIQEINTYIILKKTFTLPAGHLIQQDLELLLFVDSNSGAQVNPSGTVQ
jgi:hypothetical protein